MGLDPTFVYGGTWPPHFRITIFAKISLSKTNFIGSIVKLYHLSEKVLQKVGSILSILFVIWQDFTTVWRNVPCTVCRAAVACLPHWCR